MSERAHATAWKSLITAELGPWQAYDFDELTADLPNQYVAITVTQRFGSPLRMCGARPLYGWRLTTTCVGLTVDECRWVRERVNRLADKRQPSISAEPLRFEADTVPTKDADGQRYTSVASWAYAAPYIET